MASGGAGGFRRRRGHTRLPPRLERPPIGAQHHDVVRVWASFVRQEDQQLGTPTVDVSRDGSLRLRGKGAEVVVFQDNLKPIGSQSDVRGVGSIEPGHGVDRESPYPAQRTHQEDQRHEGHQTCDRGGRCRRPRSHGEIRHNLQSVIQPISQDGAALLTRGRIQRVPVPSTEGLSLCRGV